VVKKTKTGYFLGANGINEMIVNIEKSSFSGVMFTVRRLVRVEMIVRRKAFSNLRVDNTLDDFVCFFVITVLNVLSTQNEFPRLLHM